MRGTCSRSGARGHWNVFGADLFNEPHGGTWGTGDPSTDWDIAAERLAAGVLDRCSLVVFVEGIGQAGRKMPEYFWGRTWAGHGASPCNCHDPTSSCTRRTSTGQGSRTTCTTSRVPTLRHDCRTCGMSTLASCLDTPT